VTDNKQLPYEAYEVISGDWHVRINDSIDDPGPIAKCSTEADAKRVRDALNAATQQQPDASKLAEKDWFLCAKWTRLQDGCVARCDQPSKHEGRHLDSVIAISWRGEGWHSRNPSLCDSLDKPVEVNSDPA
jgi:hypothetical protein